MEPEKKSNGALIGSVIIIAIIIIGGIYIWQSRIKTVLDDPDNVTTADTIELDTLEGDLIELDTTLNIDIEGLE